MTIYFWQFNLCTNLFSLDDNSLMVQNFNLVETSVEECSASGGNTTETQPCIFPFIYSGVSGQVLSPTKNL